MWRRLFSLDHRRRRLLKAAPAGPMRDYLAVPFAAADRDCRATRYLAVDLETTGLDPRSAEIVSFGWVTLQGLQIQLDSARHQVVRTRGAIPEHSAVIHQITDDTAAAGAPLEQVLGRLLETLAGRVMIAHHAQVEFGFLDAACRRLYGTGFLVPVVDTQYLARRWLERRNRTYGPGALRLAALRERYNLPRYQAHNALTDALAAAELFTAQVAQQETPRAMPLKDFLITL